MDSCVWSIKGIPHVEKLPGTAIKNLLKYKCFSLINVVGLAIGLASTILIGLFVFHELSYDTQYPDAERIYRVSRDFPSQGLYLAANAPLVAPLPV